MRPFTKLSLILLLFAGTPLIAQECPIYFPENVGSVREMKHYDQRDRLTSITKHEIIEKITTDNSISLIVRSSSYDKDENEIHTGDLELVCKDGVFRFDLQGYLDPNTMASYKEMGIEVTADNLIYPSDINVGDELPDGELKMAVKSGQATIATVVMTISGRKVEGMESITTDAGTFSCYKISYDINTRVGFINTSMSGVEWTAKEVGTVRSESYNRRGRLTGYSVLTELSD